MSDEVLLVSIGDREVGLAVGSLTEVIELSRPFSVPPATPALRGLIHVRGSLVPVHHLGALLEGTDCPEHVGEIAIIARLEGRTIGLEVDDASEVTQVTIAPLPEDLALPGAVGVAQRQGRFIPIVDVARLAELLTGIGMAS